MSEHLYGLRARAPCRRRIQLQYDGGDIVIRSQVERQGAWIASAFPVGLDVVVIRLGCSVRKGA